jgi:group I intron endonuclease
MTSGVYKIKNIANGNTYVGSAMNIETRWSQHKHHLNKGNHHSIHLQHAWNKYSEDVFEFSIIEICFPFVLIFREQYWMDELKPEYNILPKAGSRLGAKVSDKTRAKLSEITKAQMTPENREKISKKLKGRISTFLGMKPALNYRQRLKQVLRQSAAPKHQKYIKGKLSLLNNEPNYQQRGKEE